jgi:hypothetical protein
VLPVFFSFAESLASVTLLFSVVDPISMLMAIQIRIRIAPQNNADPRADPYPSFAHVLHF